MKKMLIKLCGVEIYRGNFAPLSVSSIDPMGEEQELFTLNPDAARIQGEELVMMIEALTKHGAVRVHPNSIKEF